MMDNCKIALLRILGAILVMSLCACGSRDSSGALNTDPANGRSGIAAQAVQLADGGPSLPSPSALGRVISGGQGDRVLDASEFDDALPKSRVISSGSELSFAPAGGSLDKAAYAIYHFDIPGYNGSGNVETTWDSRPASGDFFIGVADYARDAWTWFQGDRTSPVTLPASLDFKSDSGQCLVVVLATGSSINALQKIDFGGDSNPIAVLRAQFEFLGVNTVNSYRAGESSDDNPIAKYEWDLDGDGAYELDSGTSPDATKSYDTPGEVTVRLRVTDSQGQISTDSLTVTVSSPASLDEIEPDNSPASACQFPGMSFIDFSCYQNSLNDGDSDDYYRLTITEPARVTVGAYFEGLADMNITLLDSTGTTVLESGQLGGTVLSHKFAAAGDFIVHVHGTDTDDLSYEVTASADYQTDYTEVEPNNSLAGANALVSGAVPAVRGNIGTGGYDGSHGDFFQFETTAGHFYQIEAFFLDEISDVGFKLYDSEQQLVETFAADEFLTSVAQLASPSAQSYYLEVYTLSSDPSADYELFITDLGEMPVIELQADVNNGPGPLLVTFTAIAQYVPSGTEITGYNWDYDGDGVTDEGTTEAQISTLYYRGTTYHPEVFAQLGTGAQGSDTTTVTVTSSLTEVENNDDFAGAQVLTNIDPIYGDLGLGPGANDGDDKDIFSFTSFANVNASLTLTYNPKFYLMGISLGQYDSINDEFTLLDGAKGNEGQDTVSYSLVVGQTYYVIVYGDTVEYNGNGYQVTFGS